MSDVGLQNTLAALILNTGVVPTTMLAAPAGGTTATLADASHFSETCRLTFDDFLGEEPIAITSIAGNVCTLAFDGLGYSSLQHTHLVNTRVYSNLKRETGLEVAPYLTRGDPFLAVTIDGYERTKRGFGGLKSGTYHACIFYHRLLARPSGQQMPPDTYFDRQMAASRADFNTLVTALEKNPKLLIQGQQQATMLGEFGQPGKPFLRVKWNHPTAKWDTDQMVFRLDLDISADWKSSG